MHKPYVIVTGLPGSGKSTLARAIALELQLPFLDKDDILERLFESHGVGDAAKRRALSRESDTILQSQAQSSNGAVLTSFWHLPGMPLDSGTPTDWLPNLSDRIVTVQCDCPPEIAALRFHSRNRHPGHLDNQKSYDQILAGLRDLAHSTPLSFGESVHVDTSQEFRLDKVVEDIRAAFERCETGGKATSTM